MTPLRTLASVALVVCAFAVAGCGGGHHHHFEGTLEVYNDIASTDYVDEIDIADVYDYWWDVYYVDLDPDESFFVDLYPSTYEVRVWWGGDDFYESHLVDVFDDTITTLTVVN
jgi:hypothetical protein